MSESVEVKIPDIGDFDEVEIIEVIVAKGDTVSKEDTLLTLESDKAAMDVPSPANGVVTAVKISVGDKVSEGSVVVLLEPEDAASDKDAETDKTDQEGETETDEGEEDELDKNNDSDSKPDDSKFSNQKPKKSQGKEHSPPATLPSSVDTPAKNIPHASPGIRRFARELGADLSQVKGSGPKGRIVKEDVKKWVKSQLADDTKKTSGAGIPPIPEVDFSKFGDIESKPLSRIQKLSGPHLQRAWLNIPHVTHHDEADITELEEFRRSLKGEAEKEGIRITLLAFLLKLMAGALKKFPIFNASLAPDGENLILKQYFNIGIAVDTPKGLVVPVLKEVDRKSVFELAREMGALSEKARDGKLSPSDLQGGCISISSLGGIGGTGFTPIVNAPEVAILGVSRAKMSPVWDGNKFNPRLILPLSLSYDHRVIDGAEGARFSAYLVKSLADARRLIL